MESTAPLPRWTILSVTTLSSFMVSLDTNVTTIALPAISKALATGISLLGWVITAYVLALAMFLLQSGRAGDIYGKKRVYLIGFAVFGAASALCGISQTIYQLIAFRVVQGIGASVLQATTMPLVFESFPTSQRGAAIGINTVAWSVAAGGGPVVGGLLVAIDWRLIFYINVPIAALAILLGMKEIPNRLNARVQQAGGVNVVSSALLAASVAMIILWLTFFDDRLAVIGIGIFTCFGIVESRSKNRLINKTLISNRGFVYSVAGIGMMGIGFQGLIFVMSFYFQSVAGMSSVLAGLSIVPLPISLALSNPLGGWLSDRIRRPAIMNMAGALFMGLGLLLLSFAVSNGGSGAYIAALMALAGLGCGLVWTPLLASALKFSRTELRGLANGTTFMVNNIAFATSVAIAVSVIAASLPVSHGGQAQAGALIGLAPVQVLLFKGALAKTLEIFAAAEFITILLLLLLLREQMKRVHA